MKKSLSLTAALSLTVTACQPGPYQFTDPLDNPRGMLAPGSVIELNQPLTFYPNSSRARVQNGKALGQSRYNMYTPSCEFYLYDTKESLATTRILEPDRFEVVSTYQGVDYVSAKPVEVAGRVGVGVGVPRVGGAYYDDIGPVPFKTSMRVRSDRQPQLHEINCTAMDDLWTRNYVSINQIIQTLGEVATVHMAKPVSPATTDDK